MALLCELLVPIYSYDMGINISTLPMRILRLREDGDFPSVAPSVGWTSHLKPRFLALKPPRLGAQIVRASASWAGLWRLRPRGQWTTQSPRLPGDFIPAAEITHKQRKSGSIFTSSWWLPGTIRPASSTAQPVNSKPG